MARFTRVRFKKDISLGEYVSIVTSDLKTFITCYKECESEYEILVNNDNLLSFDAGEAIEISEKGKEDDCIVFIMHDDFHNLFDIIKEE